MITTRSAPPNRSNQHQSIHSIGDEIVFIPAVKIAQVLLAQGVLCKIVGITFESGKVLYDLAMPIDAFEFYVERPIMRVDASFIFRKT